MRQLWRSTRGPCAAYGRMFAAVAVAALAGCAPRPDRARAALLCTAPDGRAFEAVLDPARAYATYRPLGGSGILVLRLEERGSAAVLRDGHGAVVELDRVSGTAAVRSEPGTYACRHDPAPPRMMPDRQRR
jgi:hypothetical protein